MLNQNAADRKIAVFAYSSRGKETARKAAACFPEAVCRCFTSVRLSDEVFQPVREPKDTFYGELFQWADALVFIGALGIAVRHIAPFIKDKREDPAVLCMDELGRYVIPVLSGHIGGANELAGILAEAMHAHPVITTATDINGRFSVDTWARRNGLLITDMKMAKEISAAILEEDVPLVSDLPIRTELPAGCVTFRRDADTGICISWEIKEPFPRTLRLVPRILHLGIGCRKGISEEQISETVRTVLAEHRIDPAAVKGVFSIDIKGKEEGLLQFCADRGWPLTVYSAEELQAIPGDFTQSAFVKHVTGADNVCERAAVKDADRLIVRKTTGNGVTVAVASEQMELAF